jgi:hypothetical protein
MKRILLSVLLISAVLDCVQAQGTTLSIQNQENAWFYFVIDPVEMKGLAPSSPSLQGLVSQFFGRETDEFPFTPLQPNSGLKVEGLKEGSHLLVGFFVFEDRDEFPVRVVSLQVDGRMGERFYPIYSDPALLTVSRQKGRLVRFSRGAKTQVAVKDVVKEEVKKDEAPQVKPVSLPASEPASNVAFPPLASFTTAFRPEMFTHEDAEGLRVLAISESKYWGKPGTGIREVRAELADGILSLTVLSRETFVQNISYFFYIYAKNGAGAASPFTVEVKPVGRSGSGVAILWEKDAIDPVLYGETAAQGNSISVRLDVSALPEPFWTKLGNDPSFDMTSCWYDGEAGFYEEFYLTSFQASDIPGR